MDLTTLLNSVQGTLGETLPGVIGALAILIVGWLAAILVRAAIRKGLGLVRVNERIGTATGTEMNAEGWLASAFYYLILLLVLVAFFNALHLERVSGSLQSLIEQVFGYLPRLAAGGLLLLVAWVLATLLRSIVTRALGATSLDEKLSAGAGIAAGQ